VTRRRKLQVALGVLALSIVTLYLARAPLLRAVPRAMRAEDPEEAADAVVVLAGDSGERVAHGVALWKKGLARTGLFVVSGGPIYQDVTWSRLMADHAVVLGVPREKILEQRVSRTTEEDARETVALLVARDVKSIVLVTSSYHSRRAKAEFVRASEGRVRVISCPAAPPPIEEGEWWTDGPATRSIATEALKWLWR
jgi:uncharacterized SAM-binding protein YcdF (DUF218 family)